MSLYAEIQSAADTENASGMFAGIKKTIGPTQSKCAPLKTSTRETITDMSKLMESWVEHYSEIYGGTNFVSPSSFGQLESFPILLQLDDGPTKEELSKAFMET